MSRGKATARARTSPVRSTPVAKGLPGRTTEVDVDRTVGEIMAALRQHGAKRVQIEYDDSQPSAIAFVIATRWGDRAFRLPVDVERTLGVLLKDFRVSGNTAHAPLPTREQAARVAWRIVRQFVEAQLALVRTELFTLEDVLLAFLQVGEGQERKALREAMDEEHYQGTIRLGGPASGTVALPPPREEKP